MCTPFLLCHPTTLVSARLTSKTLLMSVISSSLFVISSSLCGWDREIINRFLDPLQGTSPIFKQWKWMNPPLCVCFYVVPIAQRAWLLHVFLPFFLFWLLHCTERREPSGTCATAHVCWFGESPGGAPDVVKKGQFENNRERSGNRRKSTDRRECKGRGGRRCHNISCAQE